MMQSGDICKDIMLDIETMGVTPGSAILSIAAVPFYYGKEPGPLPYYYDKISVEDSKYNEFTSNPETMAWWNTQDASIKAEAFSGTKPVSIVLTEFAAYLRMFQSGVRVWGNSSAFDNVLVREAFNRMKIFCPFTFRQDMCYRTLKNLFPVMALDKPIGAHNALADARAQASNAERMMHFMFRGAVGGE